MCLHHYGSDLTNIRGANTFEQKCTRTPLPAKFPLHKKVSSYNLAFPLTMAKKIAAAHYTKRPQRTCVQKLSLALFKISGTLVMPTKLFGNIVSPLDCRLEGQIVLVECGNMQNL